jgi:hypothetical protein
MITQEYVIPETSLAGLKKDIAKLNKKLDRAQLEPIQLLVSDKVFDEVQDETGRVITLITVTIQAVEPEVSGWQFVATLNHLSEGENVVLNISNRELPEMYRERGPVCDHCGFNRKRRDTYVLRNILSGEHTQTGRTCLRDFLGNISAEKLADRAQWIADALALGESAAKEKKEVQNLPLASLSSWSLKMYLSYVSAEIRLRGYVSKALAKDTGKNSTASSAFNQMVDVRLFNQPIDSDKDLAENAMEYFANLDISVALSEFDHNLNVIARARFVQFKTLGYAAWMISGFLKTQGNSSNPVQSNYVGSIGDKLQLTVVVRKVSEIENSFGISWLHSFQDANGNELTWFCQQRANVLEAGDTVVITAKVKQHREWQNRKQTVLNYVKKAK